SKLGEQLVHPNEGLLTIINDERQYNAWFTPESVLKAVTTAGAMLNPGDLSEWLGHYNPGTTVSPKRVGLILPGNIPMVGFHDVLCVLCSGNYALIKTSSQDARLIKYVLEMLAAIEPGFAGQYSFVERLEKFDAVIATGSTNT